MSTTNELNKGEYEVGKHPSFPPPANTTGVIGWMRINLFSSPLNIALSLLGIYFCWITIPPLLDWIFVKSVVEAADRKECWNAMAYPSEGACWAVIQNRFGLLVYGWYPDPERWRVNLTFILLILALVPVLFDKVPGRKYTIWYSAAYPIIAAWLLKGGFGLVPIDTDQFGGIMLTFVIGVTGVALSLPFGIILALGRTSSMPALRMVCVLFIEFIRGAELVIHNAKFDVGFMDHEFSMVPGLPMTADICTITDTLKVSKDEFGSPKTLDYLARFYKVDKLIDRTYHGALIDAQLLAFVYIEMTRKQETLNLQSGDCQGADANAIRRIDKNRPKLKVLQATADELTKHKDRLAIVNDKGATPLWQE